LPSFTPAHRLHHKSEFDRVFREGRRYSDSLILMLARPNRLDHARLGLTVSVKAIGNAVNRNRVKRLVRESFRVHLDRLPAADIVVNPRPAARAAVNTVLSRSLEQLWDKLARHA
jgi:ribonuclease P protein component